MPDQASIIPSPSLSHSSGLSRPLLLSMAWVWQQHHWQGELAEM